MAPLSINLTHTALKAVRRGLLNKEAKRLGSVWAAADAFYCGAFYEVLPSVARLAARPSWTAGT